jgi:hypothetical protein
VIIATAVNGQGIPLRIVQVDCPGNARCNGSDASERQLEPAAKGIDRASVRGRRGKHQFVVIAAGEPGVSFKSRR